MCAGLSLIRKNQTKQFRGSSGGSIIINQRLESEFGLLHKSQPEVAWVRSSSGRRPLEARVGERGGQVQGKASGGGVTMLHHHWGPSGELRVTPPGTRKLGCLSTSPHPSLAEGCPLSILDRGNLCAGGSPAESQTHMGDRRRLCRWLVSAQLP